MKLFEPITVDLYKPFPLEKVDMQQNNIGRGVIVTLTAGSTVVDPSDEDVKLWAKRPDGAVSYLPCTVQADGTIKAPFSSQMLSAQGKIVVSLELISGEDDITTPIFYVDNGANIANPAAAESTNEFTALQQAISQMNTSLQEVETLKAEGLKGDPGKAATIRVGSVSASAPGATPTVKNVGTVNDAIFNFVIPRGEQGPPGIQGLPGQSPDIVDPMMTTEEGFAADALATKNAIDELNKKLLFYGIARGDGTELAIPKTAKWVDVTNWILNGNNANGFTFENGKWKCPVDGVVRVDVTVECRNTNVGDNCKLAIDTTSGGSIRFGGRPHNAMSYTWSASALFYVKSGDTITIRAIEWNTTDGAFTINGSTLSRFCVSYI